MKAKDIPKNLKFAISEPVQFNNKPGKDEGVVSGYCIRQHGITYAVIWSDKREQWHNDFELKKINE